LSVLNTSTLPALRRLLVLLLLLLLLQQQQQDLLLPLLNLLLLLLLALPHMHMMHRTMAACPGCSRSDPLP
jgi:hypothetical protein